MLCMDGYILELHILDNECSDKMKSLFRKNDVIFQRVSPHVYRRDAEYAIQTWENHFLTGIAMCGPEFPINKWDQLIRQVDQVFDIITLIMTASQPLDLYQYL